MWRRAPTILAALTVLTLPGCGDDTDEATAPSTPSAAASASEPAAADDSFSDLVEIAPGRRLYLYCTGPADGGKGTVLLEAGGGSGSEDWPPEVFQGLGDEARVCSYDRAGTGSSDPAPDRRRTMADVTSDLDLLLEAADIDGRLLLVGTSFGGEVLYNWALHHPERTAGLVILDTDWPSTTESETPAKFTPADQRAAEIAGDKWDAPDNVEHLDYQKTAAEDEAAFRTLPGIPIRILSAAQSYECDTTEASCRDLQAASVELQKQWLKLSPSARQRVVDAPHDLPNEATDIVLEEIRSALAEAEF